MRIGLAAISISAWACNFAFAQPSQLWGVADASGGSAGTTIFKVNADGTQYAAAYTFAGGAPSGSLIEAGDGLLYGMCENGGANDLGVIFSYDPAANLFTKLLDFTGANGANPYGSLLQVNCEELYGLTQTGGANGKGIIFSYNISSHTLVKQFDFINPKGIFPAGDLVIASNGLLYGLTSGGGSTNGGVIFSFDPSSKVFSKLFDFGALNGQSPFGSLMQADNGKLYGMTYSGGASNLGVIFSFDPATNSFNKIADLSTTKGSYPLGNLMQADNGLLYGLCSNGGTNSSGTLFSVDPLTSVFTKILDLGFVGAQPNGSFLEADDGYLYATAESGGTFLDGTIMRFYPATNSLIDIFSFGPGTGCETPSCNLLEYKPVHFDISAPNIFTPNSDEINDTWHVIILLNDFTITRYETSIVNRWGTTVFQSTDPNRRWDGHTTAGEACADGVYFYMIEWKAISTACVEKKGSLKGFVHLER